MKSSDDRPKPDTKKNDEEIRKKIEKLQVCPYCQSAVELIWVHGHYQCPKCKYVVTSCCGDS
jgi:ribosomal protein L37AE/L43A